MKPVRTWVLLRGLTRGQHHWGGFVEHLQQAYPQVQWMPLDLPGNGDLFDQRSPSNVYGMVQHCRAQLEALGVQGPCGVLAVSLGGMVAAQWASRWPQEVAAMVLINSSMRPFSAWHQRLQPQQYPALLRCMLGLASAHTWEHTLLRITSKHPQYEVLARWVHLRQTQPVAAANALRQLWAAAHYRAPEQAPKVPLLVLASAGDRLVSPQCSEALARAWGAALQMHPSAGHDLTLDAPHWVAEHLRAWL